MERSFDMDFEGWELLPNAHHVDFKHGSEEELLLSKDMDVNYVSNHNCSTKEEAIEDDGLPAGCKDIEVVPSPPPPVVMFKKSEDGEFAGTKVEPPKATTRELEQMLFKSEVGVRTDSPKVGTREPEHTLFDIKNEEEEEEEEVDEFYKVETNWEQEIEFAKPEIKEKHPSWVAGGVGALCSIGMAAATICIFILSKGQIHNKHQHQQNQKIQFQIYADDKRINQAVQQASRLNHARSMTRAHISFGGYYDGI